VSLAPSVPLPELGPPKNLIFRITHELNIPFILRNGLPCRNGGVTDPDFIQIGLPGLIDRPSSRPVPCEPGGTLADYVPFYFMPCSPMMYWITTGHDGVITKAPREPAPSGDGGASHARDLAGERGWAILSRESCQREGGNGSEEVANRSKRAEGTFWQICLR